MVLLIGTFSIAAQTPTQTIRGNVKDLDTHLPLSGATIQLIDGELKAGTTSNEEGVYRIDNVAVGRYQLEVRFLGYETILISEILVQSGKEVIQDIWLRERSKTLDQVVVKAINNNQTSPNRLSNHTITVEENFRYAATFNDPVRLAMAYPGVAGTNDQANGVSIRGNSPATVQWRLEGLEIVNPNHLSNAGTFSDRPSQSSGGVTILSAQMLGNSTIWKGAFPVQYGNAIGGIMDMQLRKGNDEQQEFTAQAGLIGFDFSSEGPFSKKSKASYLFNYRYSFTGLLTQMGVDLGDETINYQDASFHFSFPQKNGGQFSVFGLGGISSNDFEMKPFEDWEVEKDAYDLNYESKMGAIGAKYSKLLGNNRINIATAYSASENDYSQNPAILFSFLPPDTRQVDNFLAKKISVSTSMSRKVKQGSQIDYGVSALLTEIDFKSHYYSSFNQDVLDQMRNEVAKGDNWLIRPYFSWKKLINSNLELNVGMALANYSEPKTWHFEPNISITSKIAKQQEVSFAASLHSQLYFPELFFKKIPFQDGEQNPGLIPTQTMHIVAGYKNSLNAKTIFSTEIYYQYLYEIPIFRDSTATYSSINYVDGLEWLGLKLDNAGTATNYGLELSLQKLLVNKHYFLVSTSLFNSKYAAGDEKLRNTRFNSNYIFRLTGGREFEKEKSNKAKIFGINIGVVYSGGLRKSPSSVSIVFPFNEFAFSEKNKDYFRADLRVYWKWNKVNRSSTLAIDIQNVSNTKNEAFEYYDQVQNEFVIKEQLGMIPNLSYKIEF